MCSEKNKDGAKKVRAPFFAVRFKKIFWTDDEASQPKKFNPETASQSDIHISIVKVDWIKLFQPSQRFIILFAGLLLPIEQKSETKFTI
jgi:hypothetical protein